MSESTRLDASAHGQFLDADGTAHNATAWIVAAGERAASTRGSLHSTAAACAKRNEALGGPPAPEYASDLGCAWASPAALFGLDAGMALKMPPSAAAMAFGAERVAAASRELRSLLGKVRMQVDEIAPAGGGPPLTVGRITSEHEEDMLRVLALTLRPLESSVGFAPYTKDLHAAHTESLPMSRLAPPEAPPPLGVQRPEMRKRIMPPLKGLTPLEEA